MIRLAMRFSRAARLAISPRRFQAQAPCWDAPTRHIMDWVGGADQVKGMFVRPEQIAEIGKQVQSDDAERKRPHLVRLCTRRIGHRNYRSSAITLAVIR